MFLHEHPKFKDLIETISFEQDIPLAVVEKDYWVMHALWGLSKNGFTYYFKGGTSLSKGFDIIKRFSEDIDLQIDPPEHLKVYAGKNHDKSKHRESRQTFFEWVVGNISIPGLRVGSHKATEKKIRNYAIELHYDSLFPREEIIKRHVLLEVGFARVTPFESKDISSWCYDRATQSGLDIEDNRATAVPLYMPEYTLIEKLDAINGKYQGEKPPADWVRHYYDVFMLLQLPRVTDFIGTEPYVEYLVKRFGGEANRLTDLPAFKLEDAERVSALAKAHETEIGLYFEPQPSFDEIVEFFRNKIPLLEVKS